MDQRETFNDLRQLLAVISTAYEQKQKASLLIDRDGLTRMEGEITGIERNEDIKTWVISIGNGNTFLLEEIVAVNGLFRGDYSEC